MSRARDAARDILQKYEQTNIDNVYSSKNWKRRQRKCLTPHFSSQSENADYIWDISGQHPIEKWKTHDARWHGMSDNVLDLNWPCDRRKFLEHRGTTRLDFPFFVSHEWLITGIPYITRITQRSHTSTCPLEYPKSRTNSAKDRENFEPRGTPSQPPLESHPSAWSPPESRPRPNNSPVFSSIRARYPSLPKACPKWRRLIKAY
jgi:hypothetical protein